jgi:molecular chaperone IbpA
MMMRALDLTPLFRSSIGFDRLSRLVDSALRAEEGMGGGGYPPYNIERLDEQTYRLTMAVAGFKEHDLSITVQDSTLSVSGRARPEEEGIEYLYRGIAGRAFERHFQLADFIKVGRASLEDGILRILLEREIPEALKPRQVMIETAKATPKTGLIEHK